MFSGHCGKSPAFDTPEGIFNQIAAEPIDDTAIAGACEQIIGVGSAPWCDWWFVVLAHKCPFWTSPRRLPVREGFGRGAFQNNIRAWPTLVAGSKGVGGQVAFKALGGNPPQ